MTLKTKQPKNAKNTVKFFILITLNLLKPHIGDEMNEALIETSSSLLHSPPCQQLSPMRKGKTRD